MKSLLIVAVANNNAIGKDNKLLWHLPEDLKFFKKTTLGHPVIMGRKTYESLPFVLPKRLNIVISNNPDFEVKPAVALVNSIEAAVALAEKENTGTAVFMGGAGIYKAAMEVVDEMYITHVDADVEGDAFFPAFNGADWDTERLLNYKKDEKHNYDFKVVKYSRK